MKASPRVAVVIVNWNAGQFLERCLSALEQQIVSPQQTIVVDNGSQDGSTDGIEERHRGVRVIRLTENLGFAAASNLAIREAKDSDWVALLNPDAFPEPTWLAALMQAAHARSEFSFFGSRLVCATATERLDGTGDIYHVSGLAWRRDHGTAASNTAVVPGEIFAPCAAAALYRRDAFLAAGGFDEHYFCYFEDVDLGFRLRLLGYRSWYVPDAVARHVGSGLAGRHSSFSVYHGHRNLVWTYLKNMPAALLWLYLPQHLLLNVATVLWFSVRGQAQVIFKAKAHSLRELPRVWRQRRAIQTKRQLGARELRQVMARGWLTPYFKRLSQEDTG